MEHIDLYFYRFRYVIASAALALCILVLSLVISATGRNTVFDPRTNTAVASSPRIYDDVNVVTAGGYALLAQTKHLTITTGSVLYGVCLRINTATTATGRAVAHATIFTAKSSWSAVQSGVGWVHSAVIYTVRAPGNIMSSLTNKDTVHAIIQPSSTAQADVPTIDAETSSAVLDRLQAEQRSQIARLLDEQLAANRSLVGSVVAGDPSRGGYPAGWDNARQDSMLDSWGMYNRECVSYAAWKVFQTYGYMPYWGGVGNANQWVRNARNTGIQTSSTPKVHSVAISMRGYYGHAMWVEAVKGDMIYISQYNWDLRGHYSEMWVSSANLTYIYFN